MYQIWNSGRYKEMNTFSGTWRCSHASTMIDVKGIYRAIKGLVTGTRWIKIWNGKDREYPVANTIFRNSRHKKSSVWLGSHQRWLAYNMSTMKKLSAGVEIRRYLTDGGGTLWPDGPVHHEDLMFRYKIPNLLVWYTAKWCNSDMIPLNDIGRLDKIATRHTNNVCSL